LAGYRARYLSVERVKDILALLGVVGILVAAYTLYDRFDQHPKQNIARFGGNPEDSRHIENLDGSSASLYQFLTQNVGKRIYLNVDFIGVPPDNKPLSSSFLIVDHPGLPSEKGAFNFQFDGACDPDKPIVKKHPEKSGCIGITVNIEPRKDVEQQVFPITLSMYEVRGYFLVAGSLSGMGYQTIILKPISAQLVLS
jgi:hypothetical protein